MKRHLITDENGLYHTYITPDNVSDPKLGIELTVPDLGSISWGKLKVRLHNLLHEHRIFEYSHIHSASGVIALKTIINKLLFQEIMELYLKHQQSKVTTSSINALLSQVKE